MSASKGLSECKYSSMETALGLESLYETKPLAIFAAGYVNTSIFYFFYKMVLGISQYRCCEHHNRVCIARYKHSNCPITACVTHTCIYTQAKKIMFKFNNRLKKFSK